MSNHSIFLGVDTPTSQILLTTSPSADNAEMTNLRELQPSTLHCSKATENVLV